MTGDYNCRKQTMNPIRWLFTAPREPVTPFGTIAWWELRRVPFNIVIAAIGVVAFAIFATSIYSTGMLADGEDAVEPMALFLAPIAVNICYTAGWILEVPLRLFHPSLTPAFSPRLLKFGFCFSVLIISLPAVYWGGYRLLQLGHFIR